MDQVGLTYEVRPIPDLPFPITMIGDIGKQPEVDISGMTLDQVLEFQRSRAKPVPLREFVNHGLAVFIAPYEFSYRDLVLSVAQQIGSSHEDQQVDVALVELERFIVGGFSGYAAPLRHLGWLVLDAGRRLIVSSVGTLGYQPHYFVQQPKPTGPV